MARDLKLFVVDTGPLITLAAAQSLDYLLYVNADVVIPDAVLHEAVTLQEHLLDQDQPLQTLFDKLKSREAETTDHELETARAAVLARQFMTCGLGRDCGRSIGRGRLGIAISAIGWPGAG